MIACIIKPKGYNIDGVCILCLIIIYMYFHQECNISLCNVPGVVVPSVCHLKVILCIYCPCIPVHACVLI